MDVRIIEPGQHRPLPCIDYPRLSSRQSADFLRGPQRHDALAQNSEALGARLRRVHGADRAVNDDEIGGNQSLAAYRLFKISGFKTLRPM